MGHKYLLVTHTLHWLKIYSKANTVAAAAPAASFWWSTRTLPQILVASALPVHPERHAGVFSLARSWVAKLIVHDAFGTHFSSSVSA